MFIFPSLQADKDYLCFRHQVTYLDGFFSVNNSKLSKLGTFKGISSNKLHAYMLTLNIDIDFF
jgi:hypothetical protein